MSDTVSFAELDGQHVELLPARTVLSLFSAIDGGLPGTPGAGLPGTGTVGLNFLGIPVIPGGGNGIGLPGADG